jgi:hypothetical protein
MIPSKVDYEELYTIVVSQFSDWKKKEKNNVIRYLKEYIRQINIDELNSQKGPKAKDPIVKQHGDYFIKNLREKMQNCFRSDEHRLFALNRYIWVRLRELEAKPKREIKKILLDNNGPVCSGKGCKTKSKISDLDVHRKDHLKMYSISNCVLLCKKCHKLANNSERTFSL